MNPLLISIIAGLLGTAAAGWLGYAKGEEVQRTADQAKMAAAQLLSERLAEKAATFWQAGVDVAAQAAAGRRSATTAAFRPIHEGALAHAATPQARAACPSPDGLRLVQRAIDAANAAIAEPAAGVDRGVSAAADARRD